MIRLNDKTIKMIATVFGLGYVPVASGSVASLAGVFIYLLFHSYDVLYTLILTAIVILGFKTCGKMESMLKTDDPGCVVIDEVAGMLLALYWLPADGPVILMAYILFRLFDITKLYPLNILEKKGGSFGIMMDDLAAGLYTNIIMQIVIRI